MGRGKADPMRHIRRAAVTGLFAIWLAPLSAAAEAPSGPGLRSERSSIQVAPVRAESRRGVEDDGAAEPTAAESPEFT